MNDAGVSGFVPATPHFQHHNLHSQPLSLSWGLRCLHPAMQEAHYSPGPAVLTPDTCPCGGNKDRLLVGWWGDSFAGGVSLAGAGRRVPGSSGLGVSLASSPPSWLP